MRQRQTRAGLCSLLALLGLAALVTAAQATSVVIPREIREPPEWTGTLQPPESPTCPPNFTNPRKDPFVFKCKAAIIGAVKNFSGFTPGLWEDKEDPDWAFLRQYWQTGKQFYFSSTQCDGGWTKDSDTGAKMTAEQWTRQRVNRWEAELARSKFRPYLGFEQAKVVYSCIPGILSNPGPTAEEREDTEAESAATAAAEAKERQQRDNTVRFEITSNDIKKIRVNFHARARSNVWPSGTTSYVIDAFDTQTKGYTLSCRKGEQICYGAWREDDSSVSWGVGRDDKSGCENCCTTCGSGTKSVSLNAGPSGPPRNSLTVRMRSQDTYKVQVEFYAQSRSSAWPGGGRAYTLADSEFHSYDLTCQPGEKICYGAWRSGNSNRYWGVGLDDKHGCSNCCMTCGSGTHSHTLTAGDDTPSASSDSGSGVADAIGAGVAIGSALGGIIGGGGGGATVRRPPTPSYGPEYRPGRSGISGGR